MKRITNFIKKNWPFFAFAAVVIGLFLAYDISEKNRIQKEIDALDNQMSHGRISASETVDLYVRKRALLEQLKNLY